MAKGLVYLYTGKGEGKTTSGIGMALRAVGHGQKAVIVQFMKGRKDVGEYLVKNRLKPEYEIHQFGRKEFIDLENPEPVDYELAKKGMAFAKKAMKKKPDMLVLEEINLAASCGLIGLKDVLDLLRDVPDDMLVILTGRKAPKQFKERADMVSVIEEVKHPFKKGSKAREGVEF